MRFMLKRVNKPCEAVEVSDRKVSARITLMDDYGVSEKDVVILVWLPFNEYHKDADGDLWQRVD